MERRGLLWYGISALVALIVVGLNLYSEPYVLSRHEMSGLIGKVPCQVASGPDPDCPNTTCYKDGDYWVERLANFKRVFCSATTAKYICSVVDSNAKICEWFWRAKPDCEGETVSYSVKRGPVYDKMYYKDCE